MVQDGDFRVSGVSLNESPSEKEGKVRVTNVETGESFSLNESPSEKEGKFRFEFCMALCLTCLNESPSEKEGKRTRSADVPCLLRPQ